MKYLETRQIRYFIAVAEELHFRRAAERLNMSQPSLSRAVNQLENVVGVKLLQRTNRHVELTPAGKIFLESCSDTLNAIQEAALLARKAEKGEIGTLTIAHTDFAISGVLPKLLEEFRRNFPETTIEIQHMFTDQQIEALVSRKIDFGFLTGPVKEPGTQSVTVQKDRFVVILPENHRLADNETIPLSALEHEPFVTGTKRWWKHYLRYLKKLCKRAGFKPNIVQEAFNSESIFGLVAANMGIAIHPECAKNYIRTGVVVRDLDLPDCHVPTDLAWMTGAETPTMRQFIRFVQSR